MPPGSFALRESDASVTKASATNVYCAKAQCNEASATNVLTVRKRSVTKRQQQQSAVGTEINSKLLVRSL
ncbi:hypothetical protein LAV73_20615 [Lysinibacillus xylanilyticus]|uniref:hypothetical protein n=1 Tax=Lysinibacillus xylanilyticus TaxID=582475 RepID=UPI002B254B74|nr:hypothetical protein [Lysinibacillus xylanilyticus]MEB2282357.1 hypothetical protein [Lysinibacillus xylanilyticus]